MVADGAELCAECHDEVGEDLKFLHGPFAAGACTSCHDPHSSAHPSLLIEKGTDLCAECHSELTDLLEDSEFTHAPAKDDCLSCHNAHGSDNRMNLTASPPDLCTDCHDTVADAIDEADVMHAPVTEGRSCTACHDPHASEFATSLRNAPMKLCLSCHSEELKGKKRTIANIGKKLADHANHHGPIAQEDCISCHVPHGGANFRLLVEPYPSSFYVAFDEEAYGLCFSCHDSEMLEDEETDELTGFRNGERNLHHLHVNRDVKGRTCRACHDPHASSREKFIAQSVPFGKWSIPIRFTKTETGGSCAPGCHREYRYDRETPFVNLKPVPVEEQATQ